MSTSSNTPPAGPNVSHSFSQSNAIQFQMVENEHGFFLFIQYLKFCYKNANKPNRIVHWGIHVSVIFTLTEIIRDKWTMKMFYDKKYINEIMNYLIFFFRFYFST